MDDENRFLSSGIPDLMSDGRLVESLIHGSSPQLKVGGAIIVERAFVVREGYWDPATKILVARL